MVYRGSDDIPLLLPLALLGIGAVLWLLAPVASRNAYTIRARRKIIAIALGVLLILGLLLSLTGDPRRWSVFAHAEDGG